MGLANADFIQPNLDGLQPNLEDLGNMDILEPFQGLLPQHGAQIIMKDCKAFRIPNSLPNTPILYNRKTTTDIC